MKKILLIALMGFGLKAAAQDIIYMNDGTMVTGKMAEIADDKIKFKNLANPDGPLYSKNSSNVEMVFNTSGDYLVFAQAKPFSDKEKQDFINPAQRARPYDVVVDGDGNIHRLNIADENDQEILAYDQDGKDIKLAKTALVFVIRKDGTHQLFASPEQALPYLASDKEKINAMLFPDAPADQASATAAPATAAPTADATVKKPTLSHNNDLAAPDPLVFSAKAIEKTREFTGYLTTITAVKTDRDAAIKSTNLACDLFINQGSSARVEVSNLNSQVKNKYKVPEYLRRLMQKSGQYDKVQVEYSDVNYASKFIQGDDGDYYGTVTFVQKFQGFIDGNVAYSDKTKRSLTIHLKHYEKSVNGETVTGWDVYLDDMGVVETKKL